MNHVELCIQGLPLLNGSQSNEGSGEETVCRMVLKWNLGVPVVKGHIKISFLQDNQ